MTVDSLSSTRQGESLRATAASESRYRIQKPNSRRRHLAVVAFGRTSSDVLDDAAHRVGQKASFFVALGGNRFASLGGAAAQMSDIVGLNDGVILLTTPSDANRQAAELMAEACRTLRKSLVTVLLIQPSAEGDALRSSLRHLRPLSQMLVVTSEADYLEALLAALGA